MLRWILILAFVFPLVGCESNDSHRRCHRREGESVWVDVTDDSVNVYVRPDEDDEDEDIDVNVDW
jgi:hypothetical protein